MKIKNLGNLLNKLKPYLQEYLEDSKTKFTETHFQCPNRKEHQNDDETVACNFYPDKEHFKCFVCGENGDIFNACHLLEGRPINGKGFIEDNVLYLAKKYNIDYEVGKETKEETNFSKAQKFIEMLSEIANKNLIKNKPKQALSYLKERNWKSTIKTHQIGFIPNTDKMKKAYNKLYNKYIKDKNIINLSFNSITNRILYPVRNAYGLSIALSSRSILKEDNKKYMHHVIKKDNKPINMLYNLNKARKYGEAYLVEGASSIFTLAENNINNVVAVMGSNFVEKHYEWLVKNGIKKLTLCFDGDNAGLKALNKAIKIIENKNEIQTYIKQLPLNKDPDDVIKENGINSFLDLEETSIFEFQLKKYKESENKIYRDSLFEIINTVDDALLKEKLIGRIVEETKVLKTSILEELKKFENKTNLLQGITTAEYLEEGYILEQEVDKFDEIRWKTEDLIGLKTHHLLFDEYMDGLQNGLHMVGGKWNVGKSAFCLDLALRLLKDKNNYVLYFSIDDPSVFKTIPRMVANISGATINQVLKPVYGIENNETIDNETKKELSNKIEEAIKKVRGWAKRFSLRDSKYGQDLNFITKKIRLCKQRAMDLENKNLVVFIDFLHMIKIQSKQDTEKLIKIAEELKTCSTLYECPIITTVMGTKSGMGAKNLEDDSIKGAVELQYEADAIYLLESDFYNDNSKMYFYDEEGEAKPIISVNVSKNKLSGFKGKLFYRFFPANSKFIECDEEEQQKFRKTSINYNE
jgi:DNA primase catalytic core